MSARSVFLSSRPMTILWQRLDRPGLERCRFGRTRDGWRISGTSLVSYDDGAYEIRYSVIVDETWRTTTVGAHVQSPSGDLRMTLAADGEGSWSSGDEPLIGLFGAIDVDLAWTPATASLPIRRLGLAIGERSQITVARVEFPNHDVRRLVTNYERVGERDYRIEAESTAADVEVDGDGVVTSYPDVWQAVR